MGRLFVALLVIVLLLLQYKLWLGDASYRSNRALSEEISRIEQQIEEAKRRNMVLRADVNNLKTRDEALEELAREELGLVRQDEIFFRIVEKPKKTDE
ncbi:MAG: cell division protein FtsB [Gammaproteobacteria bacterium]|nr:MAG: cell division protein FtsB [Gammaproteobacteria bacterium]